MSTFASFAQVALPVPLRQVFTYGLTADQHFVDPGCRVTVRFAGRRLVGCIVAINEEPVDVPESAKIQPIGEVLDDTPVLTPTQLSLALWMADYYLAAIGIVCRAMMPPESPKSERLIYERQVDELPEGVQLRSGGLPAAVFEMLSTPRVVAYLRQTAKAAGFPVSRLDATLRSLIARSLVRAIPANKRAGGRTVRTAAITEKGRSALDEEKLHPSTSRVLTLLAVASTEVPIATVSAELGVDYGLFRRLEARSFIATGRQTLRQSPWERLEEQVSPSARSAPNLSGAQQAIVDRVTGAEPSFNPVVLFGVTGSGKTEVYLQSAARVLARGRNVLLLVPEIALTPKLAGLLHARFRDQVAILHSALGQGERRDEWWRIRRGEARVVVGARAAVLAPLENIGLIVVDEEHEGSYKQEEAPRYNARDVALVRGRDDQAVVLLGSATPSLESYYHAETERYALASLPERIGSRAMAEVRFVDMREVIRDEGPDTMLSASLLDAMKTRFDVGEQAILLLNRRGYAGQLICRACGLSTSCEECSVAMTLHKGGTLMVCHFCGLGRPTPDRCDLCGGDYLKRKGYGTERLEEFLKSEFPAQRIERMDRDTMRKKGSLESLLSRFSKREVDLLVGTQMLAKGHDFPSVTLVGVLGADNGLGAPDFRAAERTFQLLTQVAGRSGRGERAGEVVIQSFAPEHYSLQLAQAQDYLGFYKMERAFRKGLMYPPFTHLVNLVFESESMAGALGQARRVAKFLKDERVDDVAVLGPAFAVRAKVANRHRCQVLIKLPRRQHAVVRSLVRSVLADPEVSRVMQVDVDPLDLS